MGSTAPAPAGGRASRDETVALLSTDLTNVNSVVASRRARTRGRPDRPRRDQRRDVGGDQRLPSRSRRGRGRRHRLRRALLVRLLRQEPRGPLLGRRLAHDAARRGLRLPRRRRSFRGRRHGPADAPRLAPGSGGVGRRASTPFRCATGRRWRCCRRSAACRPTVARRRARRTPPPSPASCCSRSAIPIRLPRRSARSATRCCWPTIRPAPRTPFCGCRGSSPTSASAVAARRPTTCSTSVRPSAPSWRQSIPTSPSATLAGSPRPGVSSTPSPCISRSTT